MELKYFHTFRTVVRELSFSRAAEILNYAQSSVSAHIQALEDELGVPLFDRLGKRVTLTDAGRRMVPAAEKILALVEETRKTVPGCEVPTGTLTIGAHESQCAYRLPPVLREFRFRYPEVQLIFQPIVSDGYLRVLLGQGLLDVAFMLEPSAQSEGLVVEPLVEEPILVLTHPDHPLTRLPRVMPSDLHGETILSTEQGCSYRRMFEQSLVASGVHPGTMIEFASVEGIKQCVAAGLGIAVLPEITVTKEIAQGQIKALTWKGPDFPVVTQLAWHKDKWISPALKAFLDVTRGILLKTRK